MSKKDGTLFSSALFGYRKSDVNDYIRRTDINHADQLSLLQAEKDRLLARAQKAEERVAELELIVGEYESKSQKTLAEGGSKTANDSEKANVCNGASTRNNAVSHNKNDASHKRAAFFGMVKKK
jgi:hypothetical protein